MGATHSQRSSAVIHGDINYRTGHYEKLAPVWYWRKDFESAARYAESQVAADPANNRLLVYNAPPASRYIGRSHAVYYPRTNDRFSRVSRQSETIDLWSNQQLLSTPEELQEYAHQASSLWVVWIFESWDTDKKGVDWDELLGSLSYEARLVYLSEDKRVHVTEIILNGK